MLITEEIIKDARDNPIKACLTVIDQSSGSVGPSRGLDWEQEDLNLLIEALAFVTELMSVGLIPAKLESPKIGVGISQSCANITKYLNEIHDACSVQMNQMLLADKRRQFKLALGGTFSYEFTQGDLERVQHLLNELRDLIGRVDGLDDEHRQRILASLEKMQRELHKRVSDFDRFYGFAAQVSSLLHKVGTDAKPIVDRVRELLGIAWETQARGDELPSGTEPPLLPKPKDQDKLPEA